VNLLFPNRATSCSSLRLISGVAWPVANQLRIFCTYWLHVLESLPRRSTASILVSSSLETIAAFPGGGKSTSISAHVVRLVSAATAPVDRRRDFLRVGAGKLSLSSSWVLAPDSQV
jgi:hypothetical protein